MAINTNLKVTNLEADDELKEYLAKRLIKFEQFVDSDDTSAIADVELEQRSGQNTGSIYRAEINLKIAGAYLRAEEEAESIRNAIDSTQSDIVRQLRKTKDKRQSRIRAGARKMKDMIQGLYRWRDRDNE
ncbi:MAG: ribosome-associated translation inhibitor RaiA [Candidatus Paceibacterota bacterium]